MATCLYYDGNRMLYLAVLALIVFPSCAQTARPAAQKEDTRKVLVVFGDSLSAGYGLRPGQSFPDDLQRTLVAQATRGAW
jgi:acyl-CoA thioesterase-1